MPVNNQSGYVGLVLMLAALTVEMSPAKGTLSPHPETIPQRVERIQKRLQETSKTLKEQSSEQLDFQNEADLAIWADWSDRGRRRGGSGGWVDAWTPGWGDWADTPRWADWADFW